MSPNDRDYFVARAQQDPQRLPITVDPWCRQPVGVQT